MMLSVFVGSNFGDFYTLAYSAGVKGEISTHSNCSTAEHDRRLRSHLPWPPA